MLVVAFFNMTSALLILVLERTRMIGLLKVGNGEPGCLAVNGAFSPRRAALVTCADSRGNAVGLSLCLVQKWTHVVKPFGRLPAGSARSWDGLLVAGSQCGVHAAIVALLVIPTASSPR